MTVQRIDRIQDRVQLQQVDLEKTQQRLSLFNLNSFERVKGGEDQAAVLAEAKQALEARTATIKANAK